jgi:hypothetical protein
MMLCELYLLELTGQMMKIQKERMKRENPGNNDEKNEIYISIFIMPSFLSN